MAGYYPAIGQYGFIKTYDGIDSKSLNLDDIIWDDNGLIVRGNKYIDSLHRWSLFLCKIDTLGELVWEKNFTDAFGDNDVISNTPTRFIKTSDNGFLLPVSYFQRGNSGLYKTDSVGNFVFATEYVNNEKFRILNGIVEHSGHFYISGFQEHNDDNDDIVILKVDSSGHLEWTNYYGEVDLNEYGDIMIDHNNHIWVGAQICPLHYFDLPFEEKWRKPWAFSIDSAGNIINQWTGNIEDENVKTCSGLIQTLGGKWCVIFPELKKEGSSTIYTRPAIVLLDNKFNFLWKKEIGEFNSPENSFFDLVYDSINNNLIVAGQLGYEEMLQGIIAEFDLNGVEKWRVINSTLINGRHYLGGLCISPSGSIYATGRIEQVQPIRDYGWILKVTSDGCVDTLCTTTSILDQIRQKVKIELYPNPVEDLLTISWNIVPPENSVFYVYESTGTLRVRYEITNSHSSFDLSSLPPGPVFYKMQSGSLILKSGCIFKL